MSDPSAITPVDPIAGIRRISIWAFLGIVVVYLAIIQAGGVLARNLAGIEDEALVTVEDVIVTMWVPLGAALLFTYAVVAALGWMRLVMRDHKPVQRWVWVVPIVFVIGIIVSIDYVDIGGKGIGYTLALLVATQFVGWGEEGMFRGIGVTTLRINRLSEGKVALWSSVIFGGVHLFNVVSRGLGALPQAVVVSLAGYFFYLTRRVSGGNVWNSIIHGLFDFALLTGTAILVDQTGYVGSLAAIFVYLVLGITLLVRRHHIEPAPETAGQNEPPAGLDPNPEARPA